MLLGTGKRYPRKTKTGAEAVGVDSGALSLPHPVLGASQIQSRHLGLEVLVVDHGMPVEMVGSKTLLMLLVEE